MSTYQGCLYCKYYCVCRLTKDVCIVYITVYVDLPMMFVYTLGKSTYTVIHIMQTSLVSLHTHSNIYNTNFLDKSTYTVILTIRTSLVSPLYCKYYCVYGLTKDVCIVSITVYIDLPRMFVLKILLCM
jgi:hypothetical protein